MLAHILSHTGINPTSHQVLHGLLYGLALTLLSFVTSQILINARIVNKQPKGLYRYGLKGTSNLADQYYRAYYKPEDSSVEERIRVKALYIHPIKSCKYIEVDQVILMKTGFEYDRCFVFATGPKGTRPDNSLEWKMISQRTKPMMSLINVELWLPSNDKLSQSKGCVRVRFTDPGEANLIQRLETISSTWSLSEKPNVQFIVPLMPTKAEIERYHIKMQDFIIHGRNARGLDFINMPSFAAALPKLKMFLKISAREDLTLLRCTPDTLVRTTRNLAPLEYIGSAAVHGYTDQQPVNINSLSSVHAVSALLPKENQPLNALRFRANLWFTGTPAYAEESWKRIKIVSKNHKDNDKAVKAPILSVVCRTSRCTMPDVDPEKGTFSRENPPPGKTKGKSQPSASLVEHRTVEDGNQAALGYLGMHCVPEDSSLSAESTDGGVYIAVGDEIEVLQTGTHLYGSTGNDY